MKHESVIKKVKKLLGVVPKKGHNRKWSFSCNGYLYSWFEENPGDGSDIRAMLFHAQRVSDERDIGTDYFPGHYFKNATQMINDARGV